MFWRDSFEKEENICCSSMHPACYSRLAALSISQTARRREHAHQIVLLPLMAAAPAFFHRPGGAAAGSTCASASVDGGSDGSAVCGMDGNGGTRHRRADDDDGDDGGGEGAALLLRRFVFPCVLPAALNASPLAATAGDFGDWRLWPESVSEHQPFASSSLSGEPSSYGSDAISATASASPSVLASAATATGGASLLDLSAVLFRCYAALLRVELGSLLIDLWLPMLAAPACPAAHRIELLGALGMRWGSESGSDGDDESHQQSLTSRVRFVSAKSKCWSSIRLCCKNILNLRRAFFCGSFLTLLRPLSPDRCVEAPARLCDWLVRYEWAADEPMPVVSRLVQV